MLKVAVATVGGMTNSEVPALFEEATHLLLMDGDTGTLMQVFCAEVRTDDGHNAGEQFADTVVKWDCEALLCGELEAEPFSILAEKNSVTRYMAAGLTASEAIQKMNRYELYFLDEPIS